MLPYRVFVSVLFPMPCFPPSGSPSGWAALLALPIVFLSGKYDADGSSRAPAAAKAKPAAAKAKPPSQAVQKKKKPAPKPKAKPKPKPAPAKRSGPPAASRGSGGVGGVIGGVVGKLVPDNVSGNGSRGRLATVGGVNLVVGV